MNTIEFKECLERDIERLKTLDVDVLKSKIFYRETVKCMLKSLLFFLSAVSAFFVFPVICGGIGLAQVLNISCMLFLLGLMLLVFHLFLTTSFSFYVLVKRSILPSLESGEYLACKIRKMLRIIMAFGFGLSIALCMVLTVFVVVNWSAKAVTTLILVDYNNVEFIFGFFFLVCVPTAVFASIMFHLECQRLGLAAFFALLRSRVTKTPPDDSSPNATVNTPNPSVPPEPSWEMNPINPYSPMNPFYNNPDNPLNPNFYKWRD